MSNNNNKPIDRTLSVFMSPKGGVGCSTTAATYGAGLAARGYETKVQSWQNYDCDIRHTYGSHGGAEGGVWPVTKKLSWLPGGVTMFGGHHRILDIGNVRVFGELDDVIEDHAFRINASKIEKYVVLRPCVTSLRAYQRSSQQDDVKIVFIDEESSLSRDELRAATGNKPTAFIEHHASVSEAVNKGRLHELQAHCCDVVCQIVEAS